MFKDLKKEGQIEESIYVKPKVNTGVAKKDKKELNPFGTFKRKIKRDGGDYDDDELDEPRSLEQ